MEEWLKNLISNPFIILLGIIGGILSIISIPLSFYFYFRQKKEKILCFAIKSNTLVRNLSGIFRRVKVLYDEAPVENLTVTQIAFWNAGKEPIRKEDVATSEPLVVIASNGNSILDVEIIKHNESSNNFDRTLTEDKKKCFILFDYIDHKNTAVFQFIHTGSSAKDLRLNGRIIGFGKPKFIKTNSNSYFYSKILVLLLLFILTFLFAGVFYPLIKFGLGEEYLHPLPFPLIFTLISMLIFIILFFIGLISGKLDLLIDKIEVKLDPIGDKF